MYYVNTSQILLIFQESFFFLLQKVTFELLKFRKGQVVDNMELLTDLMYFSKINYSFFINLSTFILFIHFLLFFLNTINFD